MEKYSKQQITSKLEKAGIIQFFKMTFELAWKVLKDYLEVEGYVVYSNHPIAVSILKSYGTDFL